MNSTLWQRLQLLFEEALARPPAARAAFVESACGSETELRGELLSLLAVHDRSGGIETLPPEWLATLAGTETLTFAAGEQVAGRYLIRGLLGRGGLGEVYDGWDAELTIPVALKVLRIRTGDPALQRLKREGLLARAVSHPNVCRVFDLGRHGDGADAVWFLTMELLRGETLEDRLRARGRLSTETALPVALQIAAGLGAAHHAGVVHRDFKPANVMLVRGNGATRDGGTLDGDDRGEQAVVTDFGTAEAAWTGGGAAGAEPQLFGTPAYMAPEQVRGEPVGPAADIYALGIVLYEMVTGVLPFSGGSSIELARGRLTEAPPSPRSIVPDLDARWEAAILRCLERDPRRRPAQAEEVARLLSGRGIPLSECATLDGRSELRRPDAALRRPRHALPAERDAFVGRETEIEEIRRNLAGAGRLVTLLGGAGVGKTRLAVRFGWQSLEAWPGGVWFCELTEARSLSGLASAVAGPLGVQLARGDPIEQIGRAIAGRGRCLVILDNFEQVADLAPATAGRWARRARDAGFLITSRERLDFGSHDLPEPRVIAVDPLSPAAGLDLFERRARWLRPGRDLAGDEREAAREIVRLVDGVPLAIELAAARMRIMGAEQIAERMRVRFQLLTGGRGTRHETLAGAIEASWEPLAPWEKAAWGQCAVFEGGFTLDAAEGVLDLRPWPIAPAVVDVIQSLIDKSLLCVSVPRMEPGEGVPEARLGMFVSLQEYARLKLREEGAIADGGSGPAAGRGIEERHARWYARFGTQEYVDGLDQHGGVARRHALGRELENLIAACRRSVARGDHETALAAHRAASHVLFLRGPLERAVKLGQEALAAMPGAKERSCVLFLLGWAELFSGRLDKARAHLEAAIAGYRELGDRANEGVACGTLGILLMSQGRMQEARDCLLRELAIDRALGNRVREGIVLLNLGEWHRKQGDMEEARFCFETSLALCRAVGNRRVEGLLLNNLGQLHRRQGRSEDARALIESAVAVDREVGSRLPEGNALNSLGCVYLELGDLERAGARFQEALAIHRDMGDRFTEGLATGNLGYLYLRQGRLEEARARYEEALAIFRDVGNPFGEGEALAALGTLHLMQGRLAEARHAIDQGEPIMRRAGGTHELALLLCARIELEHRTGSPAAARAALAEAETIAGRVGAGPSSELGRRLSRLRPMIESSGRE